MPIRLGSDSTSRVPAVVNTTERKSSRVCHSRIGPHNDNNLDTTPALVGPKDCPVAQEDTICNRFSALAPLIAACVMCWLYRSFKSMTTPRILAVTSASRRTKK